MTFKIAILIDYPGVPGMEEAYRAAQARPVKSPCRTEDDIIAAASDADAVIGIGPQPFTRRVIERLERCRVISILGIGYEGVDLAAATERGICVSNTAGYCIEELSDHVMALFLALARKLMLLDRAVRDGAWDSMVEKPRIRRLWPPMFRLRGRTIGIIGLGQVGRTLVPKARGFGLRVIAYDPYIPPSLAEGLGVELVSLDRLLSEGDYVAACASGEPRNQHMLGPEQFRKMKPTALLVNTARGSLIDHEALHTALAQGLLAGAGLDVTEPEPLPLEHPLLALPNVIVTAHSGHYSEESQAELRSRPQEEALRVLQGKWPAVLLNPEVKERFVHRWGPMTY